MRKLYVLLLLVISLGQGLNAQDIHYSQFYNAPLLLNPALTGFTAGQYRISANYRNQWWAATGGGFGKSPYMTTAVNFDLPIRIKNDALGLGLFVANDQAGANTFSTVIACASISYIKTLGKKQNHRLAAGFQAGYTHQSIAVQFFQFANQFQDNVFNSNLNSMENIGKTSVGYLNLNAGLMWYGKIVDQFGMYLGASLFNITTPKYDVLPDQKRNLYWRANGHAGFDVVVGKKYHILPSIMYMMQGVDNQINSGLGFGGNYENDMAFTLGIYSRVNTTAKGANFDALIPYISYEVKGFKLGLNYDATMSALKNVSHSVGAFELSLAYTHRGKSYNSRTAELVPRF